jgi:hypothetical protein
MYARIFVYTVYIQGWTNPVCQVARSMTFCTVGPPYGALLPFALLALRVLKWLLDCWKICASCVYDVMWEWRDGEAA